MPKKHSVVTLSDEERHHINGLNRKGTIAARTLARAQILRLADEGKSDAEIVEALGVGLSTVERTRKSTWKPAGPGNQRASTPWGEAEARRERRSVSDCSQL